MAVDPAGFSACEFGDVGIFLLRHDAGAGTKRVRQLDEAESGAHPQNQFFRQSGQMRHDDSGRRAEFDGEVAVGHGVHGIFADAVETQRFGNERPVDGKAGSRQCRCSEGKPVYAFAAVGHPLAITLKHFKISHQVMAEGDGLGDLQVGKTRHQGPGMSLGEADDGTLQLLDRGADAVNRIAQKQANIGCDLVVARAPGVQALAGVTGQFRQPLFNVEVNIFLVNGPNELTRADIRQDFRQAMFDGGQVRRADDGLFRQHLGMGQGGLNVELRQALIEFNRRRVAFDQFRNRLRKAARPSFCGIVLLTGHGKSCLQLKDGKYKSKHATARAARFLQPWRDVAGDTDRQWAGRSDRVGARTALGGFLAGIFVTLSFYPTGASRQPVVVVRAAALVCWPALS